MDRSGKSAPAEDPQAEERRFEEEGQQGFQCQGSAEDVADETGVFAPCHSELEFLDQTGGHAHDEVDEEELAEELRGPQIHLVAGAMVDRLQDRHEHAETQGQRHHPEVVDRCDSELPPSDEDWVQFHGRSIQVSHEQYFYAT